MLGFTAALAMPLAGKDDGRLTMATKACSDWETDKTMYSLDNCCDVPCCDGYSAKGISNPSSCQTALRSSLQPNCHVCKTK